MDACKLCRMEMRRRDQNLAGEATEKWRRAGVRDLEKLQTLAERLIKGTLSQGEKEQEERKEEEEEEEEEEEY